MFRLLFEFFRRRVGQGMRSDDGNAKVLIAVAVIIWYSASGFMYFEIENKPDLTWADAFWWSFVTMTTVGYGDYFPETNLGRFIVGLPTMIFGISILGYLLSSVATFLIESKSKELRGMKRIKEADHILIIHYPGLDRLRQLVGELREDRATVAKPIVLIDKELEELPLELAEKGVKFVRGNPTREATLDQANYTEATHAIILSQDPTDMRSDDLNLAVTVTLEKLHAKIHTVTECVDAESMEILRRSGCDSIVCAARFSSNLIVQELLDPGVQAVFDELASVRIGQQIFVVEFEEMSDWSYGEFKKWAEENRYLPMGIKRDQEVILNPPIDLCIEKSDQGVLVGSSRPDAIRTV